MDLEVRNLRALLAVVEHGSFNRAADSLFITQPAVSKSISLLERATGTKLFVRGPRGSELTEAGKIVARTAAATCALLDQARTEISMMTTHVSGPLIIGATPSAMLGLIPAVCAALQDEGALHLELREGLDADLTPALERGEINVFVGPVSHLDVVPPYIEEESLLEERLFIGVEPSHMLAQRSSVHLEELINERWILPSPGSRFFKLVEAMFINSALAWPKDVIISNSLSAQEQIAINSGRIILMTDIHRVGRHSPLVPVALASSPIRKFGWRRLKSLPHSPASERFIDKLRLIVAQHGFV